jgi:hypothetical protein
VVQRLALTPALSPEKREDVAGAVVKFDVQRAVASLNCTNSGWVG